MEIAVVGTGFIGGTLGRALARSGNAVRFGSRHPDDDEVAQDSGAAVATVADAIAGAEVVILAVPSAGIAEFASEHGDALASKLVIDATNKMGGAVANSRAELPATIGYARAFNTVGGENMADPLFDGTRADMLFSAPEDDRTAVEAVIAGVGLRPVDVGADREELIDALFELWIAIAIGQGRGRRLAWHLREG